MKTSLKTQAPLDNHTSGANELSEAEALICETIGPGIIKHSRLQTARQMVERVIAENQKLSETRHMILIGDSGCGKSTLLDIIRADLPPIEQQFTLGIRCNQPVLTLSLPSTITPRSMAVQMLRALGEQSRLNGTCQELTERLINYLRNCHVKVVFLDEFQHLLALGRGSFEGANKRLIEARNWIKSIIVATRVTFVLMGMQETLALIDAEPQMERRFTHLFALEPFARPTDDDRELVGFVDGLLNRVIRDTKLFHSVAWFSKNPDNAERLYVATRGVPSVIKDLTIRAAILAHQENSTRIETKHFAAAFAEVGQARLNLEAARRRREQRQTLAQALDGAVVNPFQAGTDQIKPLLLQMAA